MGKKRRQGKLVTLAQNRIRGKPHRGMTKDAVNSLPDRILLPPIFIVIGGVFGGAFTYLFFRNVALSILLGVGGLLISFLWMIVTAHRWKNSVSYREYQESRLGK